MKANLKITDIKKVFEGEFKPGVLPAKTVGRYCDCFVYYIYGKARYSFNDYSFVATSQNIIYLSKNSIYTIDVLEESKFICVDFVFDGSKTIQKSDAFKCNSQSAGNLFSKMLHIYNEKSISFVPQMFSLTYNIYSEVIRAENRLYAQKNIFLSNIISYVTEHYTELDFTVRSVAVHFGISEVHLRRIFKQSLYTSPIKYINNLKIEKAKNMLRVSNYTISEIATSIGLDDKYYFSRFFKKETGYSPLKYKKEHCEKV